MQKAVNTLQARLDDLRREKAKYQAALGSANNAVTVNQSAIDTIDAEIQVHVEAIEALEPGE